VPPSFPEHRRRRLRALAGLAALLCLAQVRAAAVPGNPLQVGWELLRATRDDETMLMDDVVIRQAQGTLIRASKAEGSNIDNRFMNSHWVLTGKVHIEYDSFVLDAESATVVFANNLIQSIQVRGAPARFSRPGMVADQVYRGTAQAIAFDGGRRQVRFTGQSWFSYGTSEGISDKPLVYDLGSSTLSSENDGSGTPINMTIQGRLQVKCDELRAMRGDGTMLMAGLVMTQPRGGLVTASKAEGSGLSEGTDDSRWNFSDQVHVEYERFVMDADTATVQFASQLIQWIEVHGRPASFSHPGKAAGWDYSATAGMITFDGDKRLVRFTDHTRFAFGPHRGDSPKPLVYELDTGVFRSEPGSDPDASINMTFERDAQGRITPPQKPDRSKAQ
jgi:lipopolysaccharide export system protein LptA